MTIYMNNLSSNWHCSSIMLRQQPASINAVPADFTNKERSG